MWVDLLFLQAFKRPYIPYISYEIPIFLKMPYNPYIFP
jgi:hypothetical protein